ncbi:hypothetical protein [Neisseria montereyensis]|uniref:Uncharacterized protein n=1 Tax=Neisseria montereyensis TaxID=2973938 RepID=A0ABT2FEV3_9NEIS|nr:hypothetical protein [Neisseria montereyensis]MCS4534269.1 hypothetical protein [Neisseria montereyensis]
MKKYKIIIKEDEGGNLQIKVPLISVDKDSSLQELAAYLLAGIAEDIKKDADADQEGTKNRLYQHIVINALS